MKESLTELLVKNIKVLVIFVFTWLTIITVIITALFVNRILTGRTDFQSGFDVGIMALVSLLYYENLTKYINERLKNEKQILQG